MVLFLVNGSVSQVINPLHIVRSTRLFDGRISFGDVMQSADRLPGDPPDSPSPFRNAYDSSTREANGPRHPLDGLADASSAPQALAERAGVEQPPGDWPCARPSSTSAHPRGHSLIRRSLDCGRIQERAGIKGAVG